MDLNQVFHETNFRFVLARPKEKIPYEKNWQTTANYSWDDIRVRVYNGNIGILTGNGLIIFDCDRIEAERLARQLPDTLVIGTSMNEGYRKKHFYFRCPLERKMILNDYEIHLGEIQAKGQQCIIPPSIHPSGVAYEILEPRPIASVSVEELKRTVSPFVSFESESHKTLNIKKTLKNGVLSGSRNETLFRSACKLLCDGYQAEQIESIISVINTNSPEPLEEKEIDTIIKSSMKYHNDGPKKYYEKTHFVPLRLANDIISYHVFKTVDNETYYFEDGIYKPAEKLIDSYILKLLNEDIGVQRCREVGNCIRIATQGEICQLPLNYINLKNGLFDIETRALTPHNPEYFTTTRIPIEYQPGAFPGDFLHFMEEVVHPDDTQVLREFFGYCLYRDYPIAKAVMLIGSGANGKSTLLECLKRFVGVGNVASVPLQSLTKDFRVVALNNKLINYYPDLSSKAFNDTGQFKILTGNDFQAATRKYKDEIYFTNYAKLIFSCNNLPANYEDDSDAFYRRWIYIEFPNQFVGKNADPRKLDKISSPLELSGILNWALEGLYSLLKQNQFSINKTTQETRIFYKRQSNPSGAFADEYLEKTKVFDDYIAKDELFQMFQGFCEENNLKVIGRDSFFRNLNKAGFLIGKRRILGKLTHIVQNIKLKQIDSDNINKEITTLLDNFSVV